MDVGGSVSGVTAAPVLDGIMARRSPVAFTDQRPPQDLVVRLLEAATLAPNHHLNQPWRFFVLSGAALEQYADLLADKHRARLTDPTDLANSSAPDAQAQVEATRRKAMRAPVLVVVASVQTGHPKAMEIEDIEATAGAAEHIVLAAPDLGLGALLRSGAAAYDPDVKAFLGITPADHIVALIYLGYPKGTRSPQPRDPVASKTTWLGWQ